MMDWFVFNFEYYFIWRNLDQESDNIDSCNRLRVNPMFHTQPQSLVVADKKEEVDWYVWPRDW